MNFSGGPREVLYNINAMVCTPPVKQDSLDHTLESGVTSVKEKRRRKRMIFDSSDEFQWFGHIEKDIKSRLSAPGQRPERFSEV